jgi:uncharacterized membrane protein
VSYLFIAIVWVNRHHLPRFAEHATPRLIWWNFAHLFVVSLVPFSTAWIAVTRFAAVPVAVYAAILVMVNSAYLAFVWEVLAQAEVQENVSARVAGDSSSIIQNAVDVCYRDGCVAQISIVGLWTSPKISEKPSRSGASAAWVHFATSLQPIFGTGPRVAAA